MAAALVPSAGQCSCPLADISLPLPALPASLPCLPALPAEQETPPSIEDMLSWNTLTPHYEEDVIYALNSASVAKHFGMEEASARVGGVGGWVVCQAREGGVGTAAEKASAPHAAA